jgi:predicted nucleic acid-binding protein
VIVLDASAAVEWLLRTENGERVGERLADPAITLHAPHLLSVEVAQVLRRIERTEEISTARATSALEDLADLDINLYEHELLLPRIWQLRNNLTAYDAAYVALAETLGAPLLTFDRRLADSPGTSATFVIP